MNLVDVYYRLILENFRSGILSKIIDGNSGPLYSFLRGNIFSKLDINKVKDTDIKILNLSDIDSNSIRKQYKIIFLIGKYDELVGVVEFNKNGAVKSCLNIDGHECTLVSLNSVAEYGLAINNIDKFLVLGAGKKALRYYLSK